MFLRGLNRIFYRGIERGGLMDSDEPSFQTRTFLSILNVSKYNSPHRSNTVENLSPYIVLTQSPVKSSATKIIYAVDLIHMMLSRSILAVFYED